MDKFLLIPWRSREAGPLPPCMWADGNRVDIGELQWTQTVMAGARYCLRNPSMSIDLAVQAETLTSHLTVGDQRRIVPILGLTYTLDGAHNMLQHETECAPGAKGIGVGVGGGKGCSRCCTLLKQVARCPQGFSLGGLDWNA